VSRILTPYRVELAVWLVACGALIAGIGIETEWGSQWAWPLSESETAPAAFARPTLTEPFYLPPPDKFIEISLRPLFVVTRSPSPIPPPAPPPAPPKPTMKKDQFVLAGTTIVSEGKFVHLIEKASGKSSVVAEGKEINGILIKEVTPGYAVLSQYDDTERLALRTAKAPVPPAAAIQPPPTQTSPVGHGARIGP